MLVIAASFKYLAVMLLVEAVIRVSLLVSDIMAIVNSMLAVLSEMCVFVKQLIV